MLTLQPVFHPLCYFWFLVVLHFLLCISEHSFTCPTSTVDLWLYWATRSSHGYIISQPKRLQPSVLHLVPAQWRCLICFLEWVVQVKCGQSAHRRRGPALAWNIFGLQKMAFDLTSSFFNLWNSLPWQGNVLCWGCFYLKLFRAKRSWGKGGEGRWGVEEEERRKKKGRAGE